MNNLLKKTIWGITIIFGIFLLFISVVLFFSPTQPSLQNIPPAPTVIQTNPTASPITLQGQVDYNYNQQVSAFYKTYPWYDQIPPRNKNYFIGFDSSTKSFFVELYPRTNSSLSISDQVSQLKNVVLRTLQAIGVKTSSYKIDWVVIPQ
jgi:hypothetical protein